MSKQEKSRKCYYCGGAEKHAPGCNERPVVKEITTAEIDAKIVKDVEQRKQAAEAIRKAVEATAPSGIMSPEQVKVLLKEFHEGTQRLTKALKSWPDVVKATPEMKDAWLYGDWSITPETEHLRKPIQITRLKFKDP